MRVKIPHRWPAVVVLTSVSLLCAATLLSGCKSRPRHQVYIVRNKERPQPTTPPVADRELAEPAKQAKLPHIRDLRYQNFVRKLFTRSGCDSGFCHGENRGGGLYFLDSSPRNQKDYEAILQRIDRKHPEKSELVEKILNQVPHNGGRNIDPKSCDYARLIAWIGEQPEPTCSDPPKTEDAVRFAREVVPALNVLGCADKTCHGGGASRARFDLTDLAKLPPPTAAAEPAQVDKAWREVGRFAVGGYAAWRMKLMLAINGDDGFHSQKADPMSCAYRRVYSYLTKSPEQTCDPSSRTPVKMPSLAVFTDQVRPVMARRGCMRTVCHGSGAGDMTLTDGPDAAGTLHTYLMLLSRIEDLAHIDDSTFLRTARNQEPHGGGKRLGGKGDCVDDHVTAWLRGQPIKTCLPPLAPSFESFVAQVQPVLEKMTCTNVQCHGGQVPSFVLAYKASLPEQLLLNYKAVLKHIDYDFTPFSGIQLRMREPCAYAVVEAWIEKRQPPKCVVHDPDPNIFPRRDDRGNVVHPKVEPGPPPPHKY